MRKNFPFLFILCALSWSHSTTAQTISYAFSTVAGLAGTNGFADGTNNAARFDSPGGLAIDRSGNLYVADILNHTIRKITPVGTNWVVSTLAGLAGFPGSADGTNSDARFDRPNGVAVNQAGELFVADHYNHTIRKLTPVATNWVVTTIAGLAGVHGNADGTNTGARFWSPTGIAVDSSNHLYVTDTVNFTIRQIVPTGTNWVVTTIAGLATNYALADGTNSDARFDFPYEIAVDGADRLYVADWGNNAIREILASGTNWVVSTIAGSSGAIGNADGPGSLATFNLPNSICVDQEGALFVTDQRNDTIRKLVLTGSDWMVSTIAGLALTNGASDGLGTNARFWLPWGIAVDSAGVLYVADYQNQTIRKGIPFPSLQIVFSSQRFFLLWPSAAADYLLETTTSLVSGASWSALTNVPTTNALNLVLTDQPTGRAAFYRLRKR